MNSIQDYWNKRVTSVNDAVLQVKDHPNDYEGSSIPIKILRSDKIRRMLVSSHYMRACLSMALLSCAPTTAKTWRPSAFPSRM